MPILLPTLLNFQGSAHLFGVGSFSNVFYGKFAPVFSNLFEIIYLVTMCLAPAVAFATGGATYVGGNRRYLCEIL